MSKSLLLLSFLSFLSFNLLSQSKMDFETYEPISTLVVPEHKLSRAKFPFIDVHNHQFQMATLILKTLSRTWIN